MFKLLLILAVALVIFLAWTARPIKAATGTASWYDDGPGFYGAVHSWHWGDQPYRVKVTAPSGRSVTVTIRDYCGCPGGRLIDLSPEAFSQLAGQPGLGVGLIRGVTVTRIVGTVEVQAAPGVTLPPTDTEP
jgi:rare lipoprotein A (peptidoglycan hydrolase)